jgi:hypothetical protein
MSLSQLLQQATLPLRMLLLNSTYNKVQINGGIILLSSLWDNLHLR